MKIYDEIYNSLRSEKRAMLATIIATSGSTPAPAESKMLVFPDDGARAIGTIGGGCLDANIIVCVKDDPANGKARFMSFQLNDDSGDTGLNCGGTVTVFLESLTPMMLTTYEMIANSREEATDCCLVTCVRNDGTTVKTLLTNDGSAIVGNPLDIDVLDTVRERIPEISINQSVERMKIGSDNYVIEVIQGEPGLFIFGGGHVGKAVSRCASLAGFRVTVVDDRRAFANKERFPEAYAVLCESFEEAFRRLKVTPSSYVVIVTRGHRHDERVLEKALEYKPQYIGMIGSLRKAHVVFEHLKERGVSPALLSRVHAPIGLRIGARTAEEIGVSVVAELIAARRNTLSLIERDLSLSFAHQT